ncbi:hypothetical protein VDG1235_2122 [Verrucomicrobiia bacterium DG1235]|nr:hypothetical protein VDG1235_2122 [Verrucomicrobiae bacterium DG1235]
MCNLGGSAREKFPWNSLQHAKCPRKLSFTLPERSGKGLS